MRNKKFWLISAISIISVCIIGAIIYAHGQDEGITVTIKPDMSADRTLQERGNRAVIDFAKCTPDVRRYDVNFGSTTIEIKGKSKSLCSMNYGGEVEDPRWDGKLSFACRVPTSLGQKEFTKNSEGIDLSPLQQYCHY